jgi:hypothetical protein
VRVEALRVGGDPGMRGAMMYRDGRFGPTIEALVFTDQKHTVADGEVHERVVYRLYIGFLTWWNFKISLLFAVNTQLYRR